MEPRGQDHERHRGELREEKAPDIVGEGRTKRAGVTLVNAAER